MRVMPAVIWRSSVRLITGNRLFAAALIPALALRVAAELGYRWQSWFNDSFSYVRAAAPFACLAAAMAFGTTSLARRGAGRGPDGRLTDARHHERNLTADAT